MGRSRSSSSDLSPRRSKKSKKSKKKSRRRSHSREDSSSRSRRSRSRSYERSKKKSRHRSRSRSRSRTPKASRRRSRSRDRRRSRSRSTDRRRSRSRSTDRRRSRSRSTERRRSRSRSIESRHKKSPEKSKSPTIPVSHVELTFAEKNRMEAEALNIENSTKFEQKSFVSSNAHKKYLQNLQPQAAPDDEVDGVKFEFGTMAEKSANNFMAQINEEGLCHPNLFADRKEKEERYLQNLLQLRNKLVDPRR